jgi:trans-2,3-dihydro-3-hydroxyanthranilate isomerase
MNSLYILDVFAEEQYTGNQLAVVGPEKVLPDAEMQKIAREINFSETTFILPGSIETGRYDVRIFTPERELPFAGHPVLGTAYVIQKEIVKQQVDRIVLNLKAGPVTVSMSYEGDALERLTVKHMEPVFTRHFDVETISGVLGIDKSAFDERFPIDEVSTGLPFIIVPLKTLEAVKKAVIDIGVYSELIQKTEAKAILIFCAETYRRENHLNVRMFAPYYGIAEDPATGSANGCLAAYLVKHRYFGKDEVDVRVEQGYEIGRPSLLFLKAFMEQGRIEVYVSGKVIEVARGRLV